MPNATIVAGLALAVVSSLDSPVRGADVEVTSLTPRHPIYPKGPAVIVSNSARAGDLQAWVVRHLDGVIVKRYAVPASERWSEDLQIALPGDTLTKYVST